MLSLVGLGLNDQRDLTLKGIDIAKSADKVYIELYTNLWHGKEELEKIIGKEIVVLGRDDLEQDADKIIEESKEKDVVVFIPGDPMVATTHVTIVSDARKNGINVNIIHNSSIISAIAETGLHVYKFGATATVPFPEKTEGKLPESVYNVIKMNKENGLHTLLLLDILNEKCMTPNEAMKILLKVEENRNDDVFTDETEVVVLARAGSETSCIRYGKIKELKDVDFGKPPMVVIVPAKLHFSEKDALFTNK